MDLLQVVMRRNFLLQFLWCSQNLLDCNSAGLFSKAGELLSLNFDTGFHTAFKKPKQKNPPSALEECLDQGGDC